MDDVNPFADTPKRVRKPAAKKKAKPAKKAKLVMRPMRIELRLTEGEKAKLVAKAKATRRTVTSIVLELIEKMK